VLCDKARFHELDRGRQISWTYPEVQEPGILPDPHHFPPAKASHYLRHLKYLEFIEQATNNFETAHSRRRSSLSFA
jgi:hypothetical protein